MEDYVYVILIQGVVEALTLLGAWIWIWALGVRVQNRDVEICELRNEIRGLQRLQDHRDNKTKLEGLNDDEALADFDRRDVDPVLPGDGGG